MRFYPLPIATSENNSRKTFVIGATSGALGTLLAGLVVDLTGVIGNLSLGELLGYVILPTWTVAFAVASHRVISGMDRVATRFTDELVRQGEAIEDLQQAVDAIESAGPTGTLTRVQRAALRQFGDEHKHMIKPTDES